MDTHVVPPLTVTTLQQRLNDDDLVQPIETLRQAFASTPSQGGVKVALAAFLTILSKPPAKVAAPVEREPSPAPATPI